MQSHFLPETFDRLCQAQIDCETGLDGTRRVPWVNGLTGSVDGRRPASRKFRFRRSGIRQALTEGVDVQVGLQLGPRSVRFQEANWGSGINNS